MHSIGKQQKIFKELHDTNYKCYSTTISFAVSEALLTFDEILFAKKFVFQKERSCIYKKKHFNV